MTPKYNVNDVVKTASDYPMIPDTKARIVAIEARQITDHSFHESDYHYLIVPFDNQTPQFRLIALEEKLRLVE